MKFQFLFNYSTDSAKDNLYIEADYEGGVGGFSYWRKIFNANSKPPNIASSKNRLYVNYFP